MFCMMWLHQNSCSVVSVPGRKLASPQRPKLLPETLKAKCRDAASQWLKLILAVPDARRLFPIAAGIFAPGIG